MSLHFNSGGTAEGIETYCLPPVGAMSTANPAPRGSDWERSRGNQNDEQNVWLAHCVQKALLRGTAALDRGVRRARFLVLREANSPAILVEAGFLTNRGEEQKILGAEYRELLAKSIAEGILNYRKGNAVVE